APARTRGVTCTRAGRRLVVCAEFATELRDASTCRVLGTFRGHRGGVENAVFSGDGRYLLTTGEDRLARLYSVATQDALLVLASPSWPAALHEHGARAFVGRRVLRLPRSAGPLA